MSKKLTTEQIKTVAKENNIPYAALRAVIEVEAKGDGFNADGTAFSQSSSFCAVQHGNVQTGSPLCVFNEAEKALEQSPFSWNVQ